MFGYVMVPAWLLAKKPSANAVLAYIALATFGTFDTAAGVYAECRPALASLAERAGMSLSTVKRGLAELLELGAIERTERWAEDGRTQLPSVYRVLFGSLVEPGGSTGEQGGESTGGPRGGSPVSQDQEPHTQNQDTKKPSASPRGHRLPEGWKPDAVALSWYQVTILQGQPWSDASRKACLREHEKFTDHFTAASGANARKMDWTAAWRNWMRRAFEHRSATAPVSGGAPAGPKLFETMREERADDMLAQASVADAIRDRDPSLTIGEALELAKELIQQHGVNALSASASTGYIDVEEIDSIDGPREVSGS